MSWSAGHRPGSLSRILKHAGSETGAPIARFRGSMREFFRGNLSPRERAGVRGNEASLRHQRSNAFAVAGKGVNPTHIWFLFQVDKLGYQLLKGSMPRKLRVEYNLWVDPFWGLLLAKAPWNRKA